MKCMGVIFLSHIFSQSLSNLTYDVRSVNRHPIISVRIILTLYVLVLLYICTCTKESLQCTHAIYYLTHRHSYYIFCTVVRRCISNIQYYASDKFDLYNRFEQTIIFVWWLRSGIPTRWCQHAVVLFIVRKVTYRFISYLYNLRTLELVQLVRAVLGIEPTTKLASRFFLNGSLQITSCIKIAFLQLL